MVVRNESAPHHMRMQPLPRFTRFTLLATVFRDPRWPAIGPHEGRIAWLMAQGWKPAAYFCDVVDFDHDEMTALSALTAAGVIKMHRRILPAQTPLRFCHKLVETIFTLPNRGDLVAILRAASGAWSQRRGDIGYRREYAFAGALGYGLADIDAFVWRVYG